MKYYTTGQVEKMVGIPAVTLYSWQKNGKLMPRHVCEGSGWRYYSESQIDIIRNLYMGSKRRTRGCALCNGGRTACPLTKQTSTPVTPQSPVQTRRSATFRCKGGINNEPSQKFWRKEEFAEVVNFFTSAHPNGAITVDSSKLKENEIATLARLAAARRCTIKLVAV